MAVAVRQAFNERGFAGAAQALGLDPARQAKLMSAHGELVSKIQAAEQAHAKVTIEGDAVQIHIAPFPEEGQALRKEWEETLAQILTPEQAENYNRARGDTMVFDHAFGDWDQEITLTRDAMGVKMTSKGNRVGPGNATFQSSSSVSGANAVDKLPWRHLLPDAAVAKLCGAAAEP